LVQALPYKWEKGVNISSQIFKVESSSKWETATSGVPLGSVLGSLLFIIHINDLPHGIYHETKPVMYGDDTSILLIARST
jgi:hypothetical protein